MKLFQTCWLALLELYDAVTTSSNAGRFDLQLQPEGLSVNRGSHYPDFTPPTRPEDWGERINCTYPELGPEWRPCSNSTNRQCWLRGPGGKEYNISTNYEDDYPRGTLRKYHLVASNETLNADGVDNRWGKLFNKTYPGPWIQACWGDEIEITVENKLPYNGTTIHWHGIRQLNSLEMDGVNAITQCPIAPGSNFTYRFRAMQYGTSWYHSHYSLQYGDGLLGPMTIHGPHSANYDEAVDPILMTDWNHRSGFQDFQYELTGPVPKMTSILLNGLGSYAGVGKGGLKYNTTFERGKKYLMRLINTSVDTTFIFAIDRHNITVMSSDFVPIKPYITDHVVVGIGQRYHIVIDANPKRDNGEDDDRSEYWIRTIPADGCSAFELGGKPDERQGIIYYKPNSTTYPTTPRKNIPLACRDEPYENLIPVLPWTVGQPRNNLTEDHFEIGTMPPKAGHGHPLPNDTFSRWAIGNRPLWLNFSDPTILDLQRETWSEDLAVVPEDYPEKSWVYLIITSNITRKGDRGFNAASHPIHLHGHDFALLQQSTEKWDDSKPGQFKPNFNNPPRRDVVLLPGTGFIVIAFKADNPGAWLLHCHIAWHASSGLALQILERQEAIVKQMTPGRLEQTEQGCREWKKWFNDTSNFYHPEGGIDAFQDDSGI